MKSSVCDWVMAGLCFALTQLVLLVHMPRGCVLAKACFQLKTNPVAKLAAAVTGSLPVQQKQVLAMCSRCCPLDDRCI